MEQLMEEHSLSSKRDNVMPHAYTSLKTATSPHITPSISSYTKRKTRGKSSKRNISG